MKKAITIVSLLIAAAAWAGSYEVGYGDTLWDISIWFYGTPERWPDILQANPQLRGAEYLIPGMVLEIPDVGGVRSTGTTGVNRYMTDIPAGAVVIRSSEPLISRLQRETAGFVTYTPLDPLGYIIGTNPQESGIHRHETAIPGDLLEIDLGGNHGVESGRVFHILRAGEAITDPETGARGRIVRVAGVCRVLEVTPNTSIAKLEHGYLPVVQGDMIYPYRIADDVTISNQPGVDRGSLWVLGFRDPDRSTGYTFDVVYLSAGDQQGISPGDVFTAFTHSEQVQNSQGQWISTAQLPVADLVVITTEARSSAAMIVSTTTADLIEVGDRLYLTRSQL